MITIALRRNLAGHLVEFRCRGHAGFDDGSGLDIVCAAVSALIGALGLGLTSVEGLTPQLLDAGDGLFHMCLDDQEAVRARLLTESIAQALLQLEEHYRGSLKVRQRAPRPLQGRTSAKRKEEPAEYGASHGAVGHRSSGT